MPEEKKEKKDEGKIVLQTCMSCEECRYKVYKAVVGYPGVEDITIDFKENKVTLKAPKVDASKLFKEAKKKSKGTIIRLLHPDPKAVKKEEAKKEPKKPVEVTVVLKVGMHCYSCTRKVEKAAWNIKAAQSVKVAGDIVTIKGLNLDAKKVCEAIKKCSGKNAEIVPPKKDGEKKGGETKEGEKKDGEKKEGEKKDGNAKKCEHPHGVTMYVLAPPYFSDENPNSCVLM